jgi:hypothetical protein
MRLGIVPRSSPSSCRPGHRGRSKERAGSVYRRSGQIIEQLLRLLKVDRIKPLSEPPVDRIDLTRSLPSFSALTPALPRITKARGG